MLIESGLRIGTLLQLRYKAVREDFEKQLIPCRVIVEREQTKGQTHDYYSFIGKNSVAYLSAYLNERKHGSRHVQPENITDESLLFKANLAGEDKPVNKAAVSNELRTALFEAGYR